MSMSMSFDLDFGENYPAKKDYKKKNLAKIGKAVIDMLQNYKEEDLTNDKNAHVSIIRDLKLKLIINKKCDDGDR